jgi:hypothetical protein
VINSTLTKETYEKPSPNNKRQPGANRHYFTGVITANILKHLQGVCGCGCGESLSRYSADMMAGVHLDHTDPRKKTKTAAHLFRSKMTPNILEEVRQLRALKAQHHDQGHNAGGTKRKRRVIFG